MVLTGYHIYPFQMVTWSCPDTFYYDQEFYSMDNFYPVTFSELGEPAIWRDCRVVKLTVNPIRYNPVTGEIKVYYRIRVQLDYSGTSNKNV